MGERVESSYSYMGLHSLCPQVQNAQNAACTWPSASKRQNAQNAGPPAASKRQNAKTHGRGSLHKQFLQQKGCCRARVVEASLQHANTVPRPHILYHTLQSTALQQFYSLQPLRYTYPGTLRMSRVSAMPVMGGYEHSRVLHTHCGTLRGML